MKLLSPVPAFLYTLILLFVTLTSSLAQNAGWQETIKELQFKKFEGAELVGGADVPYDEIDLGYSAKMKGRLIRLIYTVPSAASALEIIDNYTDDLTAKGYKELKNERLASTEKNYFNSWLSCKMNVLACEFKAPEEQFGATINNLNSRWGLYKKDEGEGKFSYVRVVTTTPSFKGTMVSFGQKRELTPTTFVVSVDVALPKDLAKRMVENTGYIAKALTESGRVNLYGIYFDFNQDLVKPESAPVLSAISEVLNGEASLKLKVVGHTDNVGTGEYNQELSLRRAKAVVAKLGSDYGINGERLEPDGKGLNAPIADNASEEGRAKNRRVELIKIN